MYETSTKEIVFAVPEQTLLRKHPDDFLDAFEDKVQVLLLERTHETPQSRFNLSWFWPSIKKHRKVLTEVLIASFFVQLFGLANPLITQVIIDKVLSQGALGTLNVLGLLLVGVAIFEALLTSFRTYLFVDTTNRIDMSLGAEVIDHLVRLPLRYFDKRPVGELATRVNELENIRKFLDGNGLDGSFRCGVLGRVHRRHGVLQLAADDYCPRHSAVVCLAHLYFRSNYSPSDPD